jgi:hypothetical protein
MDDNPATMKINVALTPRGKTIQSTNPDGGPGLSYIKGINHPYMKL